MTIAKRANITLAVVFVVAFAIVVVVATIATRAADEVTKYRKSTHVLYTAMWSLRSDFYAYDDQMNMYVAVLLGGQKGSGQLAETTYQQAAESREQMAADLAQAQSLATEKELKTLLDRVEQDYVSYNGFADQTREAAQKGDLKRAVYLTTIGNLEPSDDMMPTLDKATDLVNSQVTRILDDLATGQIRMRWISIGFGIFVMSLVVLVAAALNLALLRPIGRLRDQMAGIASGAIEREARLPADGDNELHRVAQAFNSMLDTLHQRETEIADQHAAQAAETHTNAERARAAEVSMRDRAQQAVADSSIQVIADLDKVMTDVQEMLAAAAEIDQKVLAAGSRTTDAVASVGNADQAVRELGASLRRVSGITDLIAGVADQTKLLALNATIESARAGEAGRGFSVVASEVNKLAATTTQSTTEIATTITELEASTASMHGAIATVTTEIGSIDEVTAALSTVADRQRHIVEALRTRLADTIQRITTMADLDNRLERRRHPRAYAPIEARLQHNGRTFPATLTDVSESGARCRTAPDAPRSGTITVSFTLRDRTFDLPAKIVRADATATATDLGVEFTDVSSARDQLRAFVGANARP